MFVATVTEPFSPASAMIWASRSWFLALRTSCLRPRSRRSALTFSELSTEAVPTRTGCPVACTCSISSQMAFHFSRSVR